MNRLNLYKNLWAVAFSICFSGILINMEIEFLSESIINFFDIKSRFIWGMDITKIIGLFATIEILIGSVLLFIFTSKIQNEKSISN